MKQAALRVRVAFDVSEEGGVRDAVALRRLAQGELGCEEGVGAPERAELWIALPEENLFLASIFESDCEVAPPIREIASGSEAGEVGTAVAPIRNAALTADADALEIALEHEVHDPGNRIGTVDRRIAARHHVDALDKVGGDGVDVDVAGTRLRGHMSAAVDQDQGPRRAEAAQIKQAETGGTDEPGRIRLAEGRAQRGQIVERVAERHAALIGEFLHAYRRDWHCGGKVRAADARAGNHDGPLVGIVWNVLTRFQLDLVLAEILRPFGFCHALFITGLSRLRRRSRLGRLRKQGCRQAYGNTNKCGRAQCTRAEQAKPFHPIIPSRRALEGTQCCRTVGLVQCPNSDKGLAKPIHRMLICVTGLQRWRRSFCGRSRNPRARAASPHTQPFERWAEA